MRDEDPGPNLLPPRPLCVVDRGPQTEGFDQVLREAAESGRAALAGFTGLPGIGKTTLATELCYRAMGAFPDAQLYYDLCGSSQTGLVEPADVLKHFLRQLGVPPASIPDNQAEREAAFRAATHHKRVLILLDDAGSLAQVVPLLPSSPRCLVVVTSRMKLSDAKGRGFRLFPLSPFTRDFAVELIAQSVDIQRLRAEPEALDQLLTLCGGLPLALRVVASTLDTQTRLLARMVKKALAGSPLSAYADDPGKSIGAVLDLAYLERPADQARAYLLLALHPGPEFDVPVAAALLELDEESAFDRMHDLVEAGLLQDGPDGRFRFHDVVRGHAHDRGVDEISERDRRDATYRMVRWYTHRTVTLVKALYRRWWAAELFTLLPAGEAAGAFEELETERVNLLAAVLVAEEFGFDELLPALCEALSHWYYQTDRPVEQAKTQEVGLAAAVRAKDRAAEMRLLNHWGTAYESTREFEAALDRFTRSLELAKEIGHVLGEQSATEWIGIVHGAQGAYDEAFEWLEAALRISERITDAEQRVRAIETTWFHLLRLRVSAGRAVDVEKLRSRLAYFHDNNERINEARTLVSLAELCGEAELPQAVPMLERAVLLFEGHRFGSQQAHALRRLAEVEDRLGEHKSAEAHRSRADELTTREP